MPVMVRLKPEEEARLDEISLEINKERIERGEQPIMRSTIVHKLLDRAMEEAERGNKDYRKLGELFISCLFSLFKHNPLYSQ